MNETTDKYQKAAQRIKKVFNSNREMITSKKEEFLIHDKEDVSKEIKEEYGYEALGRLTDQEKLRKLVWVNQGTDSLFYAITLGKYKYQGSVVMGNGTYSYLVRYDTERKTFSLGNQHSKVDTTDDSKVLEEINNFIDGLREADNLIQSLNYNSLPEDYLAIYDAVLNKIQNNSMKIILNKYFSLLYPRKWSKFIGKKYGVSAVKKLLDLEVNTYAKVQAELMKIQYNLTSNEDMSPYEFMLTYDTSLEKDLVDNFDVPDNQNYLFEDFDPGLSSEDWLEILTNNKDVTEDQLVSLKRMLDFGGEATCKQLSERYGQSWQYYNRHCTSLAATVANLKKIELLKRENDKSRYWPILFMGRKVEEPSQGAFSWKLRAELRTALEKLDLSRLDLYTVSRRIKQEDNYSLYSKKLISSKNIIFRGAPGTGKTYLARQIAAEIISGGRTSKFEELTDKEKMRFEFVQFHPSYDYTDFVEGYRPTTSGDNQMGFELMPGVFKKFLNHAINSQHSDNVDNFDEAWTRFFEEVNEAILEAPGSAYKLETLTGKSMNIKPYVKGSMEGVQEVSTGTMYFNKEQCYNIYRGLPGVPKEGLDNYRKAIVKHLKAEYGLLDYVAHDDIERGKPYVFVIDEINRGEISKIFGELFFAIDPGYRGKSGAVKTQYSSLQNDEDKLYIPENVYIIGTMNDIDRSVENFDFAMRRRFRFIEIKSDDKEQLKMLDNLVVREEAVARLKRLNVQISETENLNDHYHIGPSYFMKLEELNNDFELLWNDYLEPLLEEYVRGFFDEKEILGELKKVYDGVNQKEVKQDDFE